MNPGDGRPPNLLAVNLRAWRCSRNLTLETLSERIGSRVSTISGWETGRRTMGLDDWARLADAYDVHPAVLLSPPGDNELTRIRMQIASTLAARMLPEAADEWLAIGRRIAPPM